MRFPPRTKCVKKAILELTKLTFSVTMNPSFRNKAVKRRVGIQMPIREPRLVEWGTEEMPNMVSEPRRR